jgi:hypothetical protein
VKALISIDVVRSPAIALDEKAVHAALGVVMESGEIMGKPAPGTPPDLVGWLRVAPGVAPGDFIMTVWEFFSGLRNKLRAMNPEHLKSAIVAHESLEP